MDNTGKLAYKKTGFLAGLIGRLEKPTDRLSHSLAPYVLRFPDKSGVLVQEDDYELVENENELCCKMEFGVTT